MIGSFILYLQNVLSAFPVRKRHHFQQAGTYNTMCALQTAFGQILFTIWTHKFYNLALPAGMNIQHYVWTRPLSVSFLFRTSEKSEESHYQAGLATVDCRANASFAFGFHRRRGRTNLGAKYIRNFRPKSEPQG